MTWEPHRSHVSVAGEFDVSFEESGTFIVTMLTEQRLPVGVDLSGITLFCASGVRWLASLYLAVDADVRVVAASDPVLRVLNICGVPMHSSGRPQSASRRSLSLN